MPISCSTTVVAPWGQFLPFFAGKELLVLVETGKPLQPLDTISVCKPDTPKRALAEYQGFESPPSGEETANEQELRC
jgi:hypothetical protein